MFQMRGTLFFFFKQKTAYEMRISDWSSDVCSSDLPARRTLVEPRGIAVAAPMAPGVERLSPIGQPRTVRNGPTQSVQRRIARQAAVLDQRGTQRGMKLTGQLIEGLARPFVVANQHAALHHASRRHPLDRPGVVWGRSGWICL